MKIHQLNSDEALASLRSGPNGLSSQEAHRRLIEYGPNRVERVRATPLALRFLRGFTHFFALILWLAALLAFTAAWYQPGQGMATLGGAILGVILVNGLFSFWQEYRAEQSAAALQRMLPQQVKALRDGAISEILAEELVPGDVILFQEGDDVPADCRLIEAFGVRVNNATVTGESVPIARNAQPSSEEVLLLARNVLLAGTSVVSGEARAVVFATGMHSEFGQIAHLTQATVESLSPLQREIVHLSRFVALLATGIGLTLFLIGQALALSFWQNLLFAIGMIVALVPEGLLPTVTLSLAMGSQRMARKNALIRHLPAVETLGCATVICTDKTGTLTQNRMSVKTLYLHGEMQAPSSTLLSGHTEFTSAARLCHNLKLVERNAHSEWLGDPMEVALLQMADSAEHGVITAPRVDEIPFDTDRKRMSTLHQLPDGLRLYTKGALETLLPLCRYIQTDTGPQELTPQWRGQFLQAQEHMANDGLRVLGFAWRTVEPGYDREHLELDLILTGLAGLEDPPRPEVPDAISKCHQAGIKVIMVTGDHPHTALAVARQIGLVQSASPEVITGPQLRRLSHTQLRLALDAPEIIFARVGADQKMHIVHALQAKHQIVALTGDGVNDAPALRAADIGIAMGISGTDVAREAADMILMDDNFASIVDAVEEGRAVFQNIRKFLTYILTSNTSEVVPYLAFVLFSIPLPLTIVQILAVDLGTDLFPALALGVEKPDPLVMRQAPRPRDERLLNRPLLLRAYLFLGVITASAAMAAYFFVLHTGGWRYGQALANDAPLYVQATTACLSAITVMQIVNVWLCRSERASVFSLSFTANRWIFAAIAFEILLILFIDYSHIGNLIYGTAPISWQVWLFVVPFALGMLLLEELRKWWMRRDVTRH